MKATEQYFPAVMFIMLYKVVLTFEFADNHSSNSYWAVLFCGTVIVVYNVSLLWAWTLLGVKGGLKILVFVKLNTNIASDSVQQYLLI